MTKKVKDNLHFIGAFIGIGAIILAGEYLVLVQFAAHGWGK